MVLGVQVGAGLCRFYFMSGLEFCRNLKVGDLEVQHLAFNLQNKAGSFRDAFPLMY